MSGITGIANITSDTAYKTAVVGLLSTTNLLLMYIILWMSS